MKCSATGEDGVGIRRSTPEYKNTAAGAEIVWTTISSNARKHWGELKRICMQAWVSEGEGLRLPGFWNLTFSYWIFSKKGCFCFEWVEWNFTTFGPPGKIHFCPPWKQSFWHPCMQVYNTGKSKRYTALAEIGTQSQIVLP